MRVAVRVAEIPFDGVTVTRAPETPGEGASICAVTEDPPRDTLNVHATFDEPDTFSSVAAPPLKSAYPAMGPHSPPLPLQAMHRKYGTRNRKRTTRE
jgi:hypothetical protein